MILLIRMIHTMKIYLTCTSKYSRMKTLTCDKHTWNLLTKFYQSHFNMSCKFCEPKIYYSNLTWQKCKKYKISLWYITVYYYVLPKCMFKNSVTGLFLALRMTLNKNVPAVFVKNYMHWCDEVLGMHCQWLVYGQLEKIGAPSIKPAR